MKRLARIALPVCCGFFAATAFAQVTASDLAQRAGFTQRLDESIPAALSFDDEAGRAVHLSDYFGESPLILVFAWYGCTTLCPTIVGNLADALARSGLGSGAYQVVVASIDPRDSPADAQRMKRVYLADPPARADAGNWHVLTGSAASIAALTDAAGFRYTYDARSHQFAHPAGIVLVTPRGAIARYFFGFDFTPPQLRDALRAAAAERIASPVDRLLLLCFHFAPAGRYGARVMDALRLTSIALLLAGGAAIVAMRRRTRADAKRSR